MLKTTVINSSKCNEHGYGVWIVLAVLLNLCDIFCGKDKKNFFPEGQVSFQTFGHMVTY